MKVVRFNQEIFDVLTECGFLYCYSKTVTSETTPGKVSIFLTPVGPEPDSRVLPAEYDSYYSLTEEPQQMINVKDENTDVFINLNDTLLKECYE